ncbi:hypothetical protein Pan241w_23480 [Gimesia alba]|uniref:Uncharacterized protein n=1 Tax=Gimesia alba TaxID=2527973 RepID=A0A517REG1_9PLAN|nr:hypothetical protein [Gimesia alba]QDT42265.1 hypothetical protein Pan241w_23480 [Gimesia alba]
MKRLLTLAVAMGLFYVTMASFSSAHQKAAELKSVNSGQKKSDEYSNYDRDDLKTGLARAYYDALMNAKNDIEDNEGDNDLGEYKGPDGKNHTAFDEARRTILQADRILARVKAENKKALVKLRNPPRRILPGQKQPPKAAVSKKQVLKQKIEAQEKLLKRQEQKLASLKKELETAPAK